MFVCRRNAPFHHRCRLDDLDGAMVHFLMRKRSRWPIPVELQFAALFDTDLESVPYAVMTWV